ncbi:MAG: ATP synthase subunit I [Clostridia bacterium]|nr:ATP synthase subunit I [Clostridia bacterium]
MKLQKASVYEIRRMAIGSAILGALEIAVFFVLWLLNIVERFYPAVIGAFGGVLMAIFSFTLLCLAIQKAADTRDQKLMKNRMQFSYNIRLALQAGWVVAAFFIPFINVIAAGVPLLFPSVIILALQRTGKLVSPSERKNSDVPKDEEEEDDKLETFEV